MQNRLQTIQTISKYALGLMAFLAGLDKFLNLLTNWEQYVSPLAQRMLPLSPTSLMHVVGVIEMVVGLAILSKATRLGAYVAAAWLVCIALALLTTGHFFDVMTNGFGAMPPYNVQVPVNDRWAIIAYIRALQLSQNGTINDVPPAQRAQLGGAQ